MRHTLMLSALLLVVAIPAAADTHTGQTNTSTTRLYSFTMRGEGQVGITLSWLNGGADLVMTSSAVNSSRSCLAVLPAVDCSGSPRSTRGFRLTFRARLGSLLRGTGPSFGSTSCNRQTPRSVGEEELPPRLADSSHLQT